MRTSVKLAVASAALVLAPLGATAASRAAPEQTYGAYIASDAGYLAGQSGTATTLTFGAGYRFNRYFALEGGYSGIFVQGASAHGGYVDAYGYLPLGRHSRLSLFGTVGGAYVGSVLLNGSAYSASASGVRGGGGVEWRFSNRWALRGTVRYQSVLESSVVTSVGFTFRF
jgi:hypothetical protein